MCKWCFIKYIKLSGGVESDDFTSPKYKIKKKLEGSKKIEEKFSSIKKTKTMLINGVCISDLSIINCKEINNHQIDVKKKFITLLKIKTFEINKIFFMESPNLKDYYF